METPDPKPDMDKVESDLRVDLNAFCTLTDRDDEAFLRKHLPRAAFSRVKRQRIKIVWRYVRRMANNAAIVIRLAESSRQDANVDIAEAARNAVDLASQVRWQCRAAYTKLAVEYMFPAIAIRMRK